uniref:Ribosomal protein S16 n=1 Tax=Adiantum nelumboides TaxID=2759587 RepID=A0A7D7FDY6_9MONI|nr:ribosomal protein S16 [Adiantum nelumboides]QMQ99204.1 ribosomal protein S16 [Adiantum nelumboides]
KVKLYLKQCGRKQRVTRVIVIDVQSLREQRVTKKVGFYNPRGKEIQLYSLAITASCRSGANETVFNILKRAKSIITWT